MRTPYWLLLLLVIFLGGVASKSEVIMMMLMVSIIGIPIAVLIQFSWLFFLIALATWIISELLGGSIKAVAAGAVITVVIMPVALTLSVGPFNNSIDERVKSLVAADHDDGTRPVADVIAVRYLTLSKVFGPASICDDFCQRALLNGVVKQVLVTREDGNSAIDPSKMVVGFRMERSATCPPADLQPRDGLNLESESGDRFNRPRANVIMKREIARGNCLIAEEVPLRFADIVLSQGDVHHGNDPGGYKSSPSTDTTWAERITMHEKRGGAYVETFRKTYVRYTKRTPLYFQKSSGYGSKERMDWAGFLTGRMGYNLALRRDS